CFLLSPAALSGRLRQLVCDPSASLLVPEPYGTSLAQRARARLCEHERREPVLSRHRRLPVLADGRRELLELPEVRVPEQLDEVGDPVERRAALGQPFGVRAAMAVDANGG